MTRKVLILNEDEVHDLLGTSECITVMEQALLSLTRDAFNPLRQVLRPPAAGGLLGLMPAYLPGPRPRFGLKEVCVFPGNPARGLDSHLGTVLLHDGETGELLAVVNAAAVTAIRTAAVSALATRLLSRQDSHVMTLVGAGAQAQAHAKSISSVRSLRRIFITSRSRERGVRLSSELTASLGIECIYEGNPEVAIAAADIVTTVTSSSQPILKRSWVRPGTHINAVGSSVRSAREIDGETMAAARLFVDRRESTLNESGDFLSAQQEGLIGPQHIVAEIGEILAGSAEARRTAEEITLFKSLGLAIEDLAAADYLLDKATELGRGTWVHL